MKRKASPTLLEPYCVGDNVESCIKPRWSCRFMRVHRQPSALARPPGVSDLCESRLAGSYTSPTSEQCEWTTWSQDIVLGWKGSNGISRLTAGRCCFLLFRQARVLTWQRIVSAQGTERGRLTKAELSILNMPLLQSPFCFQHVNMYLGLPQRFDSTG